MYENKIVSPTFPLFCLPLVLLFQLILDTLLVGVYALYGLILLHYSFSYVAIIVPSYEECHSVRLRNYAVRREYLPFG